MGKSEPEPVYWPYYHRPLMIGYRWPRPCQTAPSASLPTSDVALACPSAWQRAWLYRVGQCLILSHRRHFSFWNWKISGACLLPHLQQPTLALSELDPSIGLLLQDSLLSPVSDDWFYANLLDTSQIAATLCLAISWAKAFSVTCPNPRSDSNNFYCKASSLNRKMNWSRIMSSNRAPYSQRSLISRSFVRYALIACPGCCAHLSAETVPWFYWPRRILFLHLLHNLLVCYLSQLGRWHQRSHYLVYFSSDDRQQYRPLLVFIGDLIDLTGERLSLNVGLPRLPRRLELVQFSIDHHLKNVVFLVPNYVMSPEVSVTPPSPLTMFLASKKRNHSVWVTIRAGIAIPGRGVLLPRSALPDPDVFH